MTNKTPQSVKMAIEDVTIVRKCLNQIEYGTMASCIREHAALDRILTALQSLDERGDHIEGLDEAISLQGFTATCEEDHDDFMHGWFEFKEKYGKEPDDVVLEAARRYSKAAATRAPDTVVE